MKVDARGDQAEYRIVCEPFLQSYRAKLPTDRNVARGASYDFLNIGTLPGGHKHRIEFMLNAEEEQVELKIHRIEKPLSAKLKNYARQVAKKEKVLCLGPFPVHVQPGTRCLVIQKSTDEIDEQLATAMEEYREDSEHNDTDRDENYSDDSYQDSDDSDSVENYVPGSPHPPSGLDNPHHASGPSSGSSISHSQNSASRGGASGRDDEAKDDDDDVGQDVPKKKRKNRRPRRSAKYKQKRMVEHEQIVFSQPEQAHEQSNQATGEPEQVQDQQSPSLDLADVARHAGASNTAASNTARSISKAPAINASTATRHTTSSSRGRIASKAETARAASSAFRSSREVSGRAASNSQTGFGVPCGMPTSTPSVRPGEKNMGHRRRDNVPSTRDASFSRYTGSSFMASGSQSDPYAGNKRAAPPEDNNSRPTKRNHTSGEPSSSTADYPRQRPSRPEPGRDPVPPYSAAQNSAVFENRCDPTTNRRNGDYYRPSADTVRFPDLAAPSRRPVGSRDYLFSNRYRDQDSESSVRNGMAELNLNHGVSASGSRPRGHAPAAPHDRRDTTVPRDPPASNFASRSLPVDSPRPGPSSRPAPESSSAGSSQHRRRFGPRGTGKGDGYPPSSD